MWVSNSLRHPQVKGCCKRWVSKVSFKDNTLVEVQASEKDLLRSWKILDCLLSHWDVSSELLCFPHVFSCGWCSAMTVRYVLACVKTWKMVYFNLYGFKVKFSNAFYQSVIFSLAYLLKNICVVYARFSIMTCSSVSLLLVFNWDLQALKTIRLCKHTWKLVPVQKRWGWGRDDIMRRYQNYHILSGKLCSLPLCCRVLCPLLLESTLQAL